MTNICSSWHTLLYTMKTYISQDLYDEHSDVAVVYTCIAIYVAN